MPWFDCVGGTQHRHPNCLLCLRLPIVRSNGTRAADIFDGALHTLKRSDRRTLFIAVITVAVAAGGGGAWYFVHRKQDPMLRAEALAAQGNWRAAQVELRSALRNQPTSAEANLRMAELEMKLADGVAAEKDFRRALALGADRAKLIPELGEAILSQNRPEDLLKLVPARVMAPETAAKYYLGRAIAQLTLGDPSAAEKTLAEAQKAAPGQPDTLLIAARIAAARNDMAKVESLVDEVLKADPNQVEALLMQEQLLTARNERPAALEMAKRAVASAPWSAMARIDLAYQLMFAGKDDDAQKEVDAVLDNQPRFVDAIYLRGILMARRGAFADAALQLRQLDGIGARFPQAVFYQGRVAQELGQKETAAEFARRYNALVPADPDGVKLLAQTALVLQQGKQVLAPVKKAVDTGHADPTMLDLLGRAQLAAGDGAAAAASFEKAAAGAPDDPVILTNFGLAELQQGKAAAAMATLEKAVALGPKLELAGAALVQASLLTGDLDRAESALKQLRANTGETETVGTLTGQLKLQRNDIAGAQSTWEGVIKAFPATTGARFNLAKLLIQEGRKRDALAMLGQVLAKEPVNAAALNVYLPLSLETNNFAAAVQALEAARKADPKQLAFAAMLADAYNAAGQPDRAMAMLMDLRKPQDPKAGAPDSSPAFDKNGNISPVLLPAFARTQVAEGKIDDAIQTFRDAMAARPNDPSVRLGLLKLLNDTGRINEVIAVMREGVAKAPGNLQAMSELVQYLNAKRGLGAALDEADALRANPANMPYAAALKGDLLMGLNKPDDASKAYAAEYARMPQEPLLMRLVVADAAAGRPDDSSKLLRDWLHDHPDSAGVALALSKLDLVAKRYDDALAHLAVVLKAAPNEPQALNNRAWIYYLRGDKRARDAANEAYLKAPSPDSADTLGWIMTAEGDAKSAVPLLLDASKQRPGDPGIKYHLAAAMKANGRAAEAGTLLKAALESKQPFPDRDAAQKMLTEIGPKP